MASRISLSKEIAIFVVLVVFGMVLLPISIYVVGQKVIGEYAPNAGVLDLMGAIWADLAAFRPAAWLLTLSPYIVVTLLRIVRSQWRPARPRNP